MTKRKLVNRKEAAEILGISIHTLAGWIYEKRVPLELAHIEESAHYYYLADIKELKKNYHKYFNPKYRPINKNLERNHTVSIKIDKTLKKKFCSLLSKRDQGASSFLYGYIKSFVEENENNV